MCVGIIGFCSFFFSCANTRQLNYLQGSFDTAQLKKLKIPEPVIQKADLISIVVYSDNPAATALYNQPVMNSGISGSSSGQQTPGYLVDKDGNIQFQGLGQLHVEGLSKGQLVTLLDSKLKDKLLSNPYYNIRFVNFKITLLGDVRSPGVYTIPNERITILEAVALAGDLTIYGKRDNVLIIREASGSREFGRIDLTKPDIFNSPYFYLQQNDVVLIEATNKKETAVDQATVRNISIATSIVSTIAIVISILSR